MFVDPAAASFSLQLYTDGFPNVAKAKNDVLGGISTLASLLDNDQLVVASSCENLIRELPAYRWDEKAAARGVDKPVKEDDHYTDALRYAVFSTHYTWSQYIQDIGAIAA